MDTNKLLEYADMLLKTALAKTHDMDTAQDLVQETYLYTLTAIEKGTSINNLKAYLISVLNNRFNCHLRKKYNLSLVSYNELPVDIMDETDHFEEILKTDEGAFIRKELAYLSEIYREVMVRYYMYGHSVTEIAQSLNIPKGTVISRLDTGRKKIRKGVSADGTPIADGVKKMDSYTKNSYQPEKLYIGISGNTGRGNEPFSCINDLISQNILLMAYEKPLTTEEISVGIGIPAAYVEEKVKYLIENELMKKEGTKVFTDFVITSSKDDLKYLEISKNYAKETFDTANKIFLDMVEKYKEIDGFSSCSDEWLYMLAVLSIRDGYMSKIGEAVSRKNYNFYDIPERPNGGRWEATGFQYPHGCEESSEYSKYDISGRVNISGVNDYIESISEWNTNIGKTHNTKYKYSLDIKGRILAIDSIRSETVSAFEAELIPDLEKYEFIRTENGKKVPNVPYITQDEKNRLFQIVNESGAEYSELLLGKAIETVKKSPLNIPKQISYIPISVYIRPLKYHPMAYIYEAIDRGIIHIEKDKNYPIMYIVKR